MTWHGEAIYRTPARPEPHSSPGSRIVWMYVKVVNPEDQRSRTNRLLVQWVRGPKNAPIPLLTPISQTVRYVPYY